MHRAGLYQFDRYGRNHHGVSQGGLQSIILVSYPEHIKYGGVIQQHAQSRMLRVPPHIITANGAMTKHLNADPGRLTRRAALLLLSQVSLAGCALITGAARRDDATAPPGAASATLTPSPASLAATATPAPSPSPSPTVSPVKVLDRPADTGFLVPPTIRHSTASTVTLHFELIRPGPTALLIRSDAVSPWQFGMILALEERRQVVTLEGLTPGTELLIAVPAGGDDTFVEFYPIPYNDLEWPPLPVRFRPASGPLRVGVIGDSGFGDPVTYDLGRRLADFMPDFVIHTGDVVYNIYDDPDPAAAFYRKWYQPFQPILMAGIPIYPVVGNHDVEAASLWSDGLPFYHTAFSAFTDPEFATSTYEGRNSWYAFAHGDTQFLMLNTQTIYGDVGSGPQTEWMTERLADPRYAHTVVTAHVSPISSGAHGDNDSPIMRSRWWGMLTSANVRLILCGHDHNYERLVLDEIPVIVSGGGSATIYPLETLKPESQYFETRSHIIQMTLDTNSARWQAVDRNGIIFDEAEVSFI